MRPGNLMESIAHAKGFTSAMTSGTSPDWELVQTRTGPDPRHVLRSTAAVMRSATDVVIDMASVESTAVQLLARDSRPEWDESLHYRATGPDGDERTAMWLLALDALNFCFWGQGSDPSIRWRVEWRGELVDGYVALVAALTKAVQRDFPLPDARGLANIDFDAVATILAPAEGHPVIPLLDDRVRNLRELGQGLLSLDTDAPATALIRQANGSAIALVRDVVQRFPSFYDVSTWDRAETGLPGNEVRFYKRAQILAGDLAGGLAGSPLGSFHDLDQLTAFADYKVPQILRQIGVLRYSDALSAKISAGTHIPSGSSQEMEIRAATIWGCELLRQALARTGRNLSAHELDWLLWTESQSLPGRTHPYHLTPTIYY
jgi:hypothetical protein